MKTTYFRGKPLINRDREKEFMSVYESLAIAFPKLKIIMEHITTKQSVEALDKFENLCNHNSTPFAHYFR